VDWRHGGHPGLTGAVAFLFLSIVCNNISLLRLGVKVGLRHSVFDGLRKMDEILRLRRKPQGCILLAKVQSLVGNCFAIEPPFLDSEDLLFHIH